MPAIYQIHTLQTFFLEYIKNDLFDTGDINRVLELYPSQNNVIAENLSKIYRDVSKDNIFIGNGAIEIIQAILHNFCRRKIVVNIPTFSSYYEFIKDDVEVVFYKLKKEKNYQICVDDYIKFVLKNDPDVIVLINPNNPDGGYITHDSLIYILNKLKRIPIILLDESFIHFSFESDKYNLQSCSNIFHSFKNLIIVKSMSKDFGIAGVRAGYAIMNDAYVKKLLGNGYLWNSNGIAEYFFNLYARNDFFKRYDSIRVSYIKKAQSFFKMIQEIKGLKVIPSMSNFCLIEITNGLSSFEYMSKLLIEYGIYVRDCSDKIGLEGEYIRVSARKENENEYIINAIKRI